MKRHRNPEAERVHLWWLLPLYVLTVAVILFCVFGTLYWIIGRLV